MSVEAAGEQQGVKTQSEDHEQNEDLCEYEILRQANIADQKRHFKQLFQGVKKDVKAPSKRGAKRAKPKEIRSSGRIQKKRNHPELQVKQCSVRLKDIAKIFTLTTPKAYKRIVRKVRKNQGRTSLNMVDEFTDNNLNESMRDTSKPTPEEEAYPEFFELVGSSLRPINEEMNRAKKRKKQVKSPGENVQMVKQCRRSFMDLSQHSEPILEEENFRKYELPFGWTKTTHRRKTGNTKGIWDIYLKSPTGVRIRSSRELERFLLANPHIAFDEKITIWKKNKQPQRKARMDPSKTEHINEASETQQNTSSAACITGLTSTLLIKEELLDNRQDAANNKSREIPDILGEFTTNTGSPALPPKQNRPNSVPRENISSSVIALPRPPSRMSRSSAPLSRPGGTPSPALGSSPVETGNSGTLRRMNIQARFELMVKNTIDLRDLVDRIWIKYPCELTPRMAIIHAKPTTAQVFASGKVMFTSKNVVAEDDAFAFATAKRLTRIILGKNGQFKNFRMTLFRINNVQITQQLTLEEIHRAFPKQSYLDQESAFDRLELELNDIKIHLKKLKSGDINGTVFGTVSGMETVKGLNDFLQLLQKTFSANL